MKRPLFCQIFKVVGEKQVFIRLCLLDKFISKCNPNEERPSSSDSSDSILMAEDWRKIRSLIKEVVSNILDKRVQKLNDTVQHLAASNIILEARITGYQQALQNEKKKRQRGKPLFQRLNTPEESKAIFYSPTKIKAARELLEEEKKTKEAAAIQKAEEKFQRQ
jgi:hypothetical protein